MVDAAPPRWDTIVLLCHLLDFWREPRSLGCLPKDGTWEPLIEAASAHLVTPALGVTLRNRTGVPQDVADYFDAVLSLNRQRNDSILRGLISTVDAFREIGIEPVLLKGGAAIASGLYPYPAMRIIGDIDLLIPEEQGEQAASLLAGLGFASLPSERVNYREHHHLAPQHDPETGLMLELHVRPLLNRWGRLLDAKAMIGHARLVDFRGRQLRVPSPTHSVIHNIVHNQLTDQNYARHRLDTRQMLELAALILRHGEAIDWQAVRNTFADNDEMPLLQDTIETVEALFEIPAPYALGRSGNAPLRALKAEANRSDVSWMFDRSVSAVRTRPSLLLRVFQPYYWRRFFKALRQEMRGERW